MKKFILSIIICLGVLFSWNVVAQENPFQVVSCYDCGTDFFPSKRLITYLSFIVIFFLSIIGLFFKKIRKVCKWILIIGTILLALVIVAESVVNHILYQEYLQSLNESTITEEA